MKIKVGDKVKHDGGNYDDIPDIGVVIEVEADGSGCFLQFPEYPDGLYFYESELLEVSHD